MRTIILAAFLALIVTGCVRTNTRMLDPSTAIISARGTAFDSGPAVIQGTIAKAAETAKAGGFDHFVILSSQDASVATTIYTPGETHTSGRLTASTFGNTTTGTYTASTHSTPSYANTLIKPGADIIIKMYRESVVNPAQAGLWHVDSILATNAPEE